MSAQHGQAVAQPLGDDGSRAQRRRVSIAAAAWDIPGLDSRLVLDEAFRRGGMAMAAARSGLSTPEALDRVARMALERAALPAALREAGLRRLAVNEAPGTAWAPAASSFGALVSACEWIERQQAERVLVAALLRFDGDAEPRTIRGACALLLEAEQAVIARPVGGARLNLVAHAEGHASAAQGLRVLTLLDRHPEKTLYVSRRSPLWPALSVVSDLRWRQVVELEANVPPDLRCLCLLQAIACFERCPAAGALAHPGAVLGDDGAGEPAGLLVLAPPDDADAPPTARAGPPGDSQSW